MYSVGLVSLSIRWGRPPRATIPALIRSFSTRHLVSESNFAGNMNITYRSRIRCRCRRISRMTVGGWDGLFSLTGFFPSCCRRPLVEHVHCIASHLLLPCLFQVFRPIRGCSLFVPGLLQEHFVIDFTRTWFYRLTNEATLPRHETPPIRVVSFLFSQYRHVLFFCSIFLWVSSFPCSTVPKLLSWPLIYSASVDPSESCIRTCDLFGQR